MRSSAGSWVRLVVFAVFAAGLFGACVDDDGLFGPNRGARLMLQPQFVHLGAAASRPINRIRMVAHDQATGETLGELSEGVDPLDPSWELDLVLSLDDEPVVAVVTVEMVHVDVEGVETVEWSGRLEIPVTPGSGATEVPLDVFRGPLSNLDVTGVQILHEDTTVREGDVLALSAVVEGGGDDATVFWGSSDETRAAVSPAGVVTALLPDSAVRIVAVAGQHADTFRLGIAQRVAAVSATPASLGFVSVGQMLPVTIRVLDARGDSIPGAAVVVTVADPTVVEYLGDGVFQAVGAGVTSAAIAAADSLAVEALIDLTVELDDGPADACDAAGTTHTGAFLDDQTWTQAASPHHVDGAVVFDSAAVLTIEPGVLVCGTPSGSMTFNNGASLNAIGTAADSIRFVATQPLQGWQGVYLNQVPADTSRIRYAAVENPVVAMWGDGAHSIVIEDSDFRGVSYTGIVAAAGSRVERTSIDGVGQASYYGLVAYDDVRVRDVTVTGLAGIGLYIVGDSVLIENVVVRDVGGYGIGIDGVGTVIDGLLVENAGNIGYYGVGGPGHLRSATGVRVTGGSNYGFWGPVSDLVAIAPTAADYDSLLGNAIDTLIVNGGTLEQGTAYVRPDVDWRVSGTMYFTTGAVFMPMPGSMVRFEGNGQVYATNGGRVDARGTEADPILFTAHDTAAYWNGVLLTDPDTSYLSNVHLDHVDGSYAIRAGAGHVLFMDSSSVHHARFTAVALVTPGARMSRSLVDTTLTTSSAVILGTGAIWEDNVVRGAGAVGVSVEGSDIVLMGGRIEGSGSYGISAPNSTYTLAQATTPRIVGGATNPGRMPVQMWAKLIPSQADIDSVLGNARDTAVILGGTLTNDTLEAGHTLPVRVEQTINVGAGGLIVVAPGLAVPFHQNAGLTASGGGTLDLRGTAAQPITLQPVDTAQGWYGIVLHDAPTDTTHVRHVRIEHAYSGHGAIGVYDQHVLVVDSSLIRQSRYYGLYVRSPGSRIAASVIDTTHTVGYPAVVLGNGVTWDNSVVRGSAHNGLVVTGTGTSLLGGRIEGSAGLGLYVPLAYSVTAAQPLRITGSGSYPVSVGLGTFATMYPTSALQDSLLGNARDTVSILGGTLIGDTVVAGAALPWRLETYTYLTQNSHLEMEPGARIAGVVNSRLYAQTGATIHANGTAAEPVTLTSVDPADRWHGVSFSGAPTDTSRLTHVLVENARDATAAVEASGTHTLVIDSSRVRNSQYRAVYLGSPGSVLRNSVIDTTLTAGYSAVLLAGVGTRIERGVIRGAADVGLQVTAQTIDAASVVPRIVDGAGYPLRTPISGYAALFDTRADQDSVLGNARDSVAITGGTLVGDTVLAGSSLPWRLETFTYFTADSRLDMEPGAGIAGVASSELYFRTGSTLQAIGTVTDSITFAAVDPATPWYGIQFEDAPADTSRLRYVLARGSRDSQGVLYAIESHVALIDSSRVVGTQYNGVTLASPGSWIRHSHVDSAGSVGGSGAVELRAGTGIERGRISNAGGVSLYLWEGVDPASVTPRIVGSEGYPVRAELAEFVALVDTRADQDSLTGNVVDTVYITGGGVVGSGTVVVAANLPWRITGTSYIDTTAVLAPEPGATIAGEPGAQLHFRHGGTLSALGTETDSIRFTSTDPAARWGGLRFHNDPLSASRMVHTLVENGSATVGTLYTSSTHALEIDSSRIANSQYTAVNLATSGSHISDSRVEGTLIDNYPAVILGGNTLFQRTTVSGSGDIGVRVAGSPVQFNGGTIEGSADFGIESSSVTHVVDMEVSPIITGGLTYPARLTPTQLTGLAPSAQDRAGWLGNARDTVEIIGGTMASSATVTANLPWRVTTDLHFSGFGVELTVEPGATLIGGNGVDYYFENGATLQALGTAAQPILFSGEDTVTTVNWWGGLRFEDAPADTSRVTHALIEFGRHPEGQLFSTNTHVLRADSVHIRNSLEQAVRLDAPGSMLRYATIDTVLSITNPAVRLGANTTMSGTRIRGAMADGLAIVGDNVIVTGSEIAGSLGDGVEISSAADVSVAINGGNIIDNGNGDPSNYGINRLGIGTIDASDNWWGSPSGPPGSNSNGVAGDVTTDPVASVAHTIPAWEASP